MSCLERCPQFRSVLIERERERFYQKLQMYVNNISLSPSSGCSWCQPSTQRGHHWLTGPSPALDNSSILRYQHDRQHEMPRVSPHLFPDAHCRRRIQDERLRGAGISAVPRPEGGRGLLPSNWIPVFGCSAMHVHIVVH